MSVSVPTRRNYSSFFTAQRPTIWDISSKQLKFQRSVRISKEESIVAHSFARLLFPGNIWQSEGNTNTNKIHSLFGGISPITPLQARNTLRKILKSLNIDLTLYSLHSFRIGRSGDLLKLGYTIEWVKILGRWRSNIVYRYLRQAQF